MQKKLFSALVFAVVSLCLQAAPGWATICGSAYFNHDVNWLGTSDLYFSVAGSPANTCGDLWAWRNGSGYTLEAAGWICTNSLGQATKGPWNASTHSTDETAYVFINWPACNSDEAKHVFDVTAPIPTITSSIPSAFSGSASDGTWGAGFDASWAVCYAEYYDGTSNRWWSPSTGSYSETSPVYVSCSISGMPSLSVTWSASQKPGSHQSTHHYYWTAWLWDGGQWGTDTDDFIY